MKKIAIPVVSIISTLAGVVVGVRAEGKKTKEEKDMSYKHLSLFLMMNQWVKVKQENKNLSEYFERNGYKRIAVYGMSYAGETLISELQNTGIQVVYGIDKDANFKYADIDVVTADDNLEEVDAIIVTAITFFDEIEAKLADKVECPIISLEDILYEV